MRINRFLNDLDRITDPETLKARLLEETDALGATAVLVHPLPMAADAPEWAPVLVTFDPSVRREYERRGFEDDPFLEATLASGGPIRFLDKVSEFKWSEPQLRVFNQMADLGYVDGVATAVIARPGLNAYCALAFPSDRADLNACDLRRIHIMFTEFYVRDRALAPAARPAFSARERQILVGLMRGRSNAAIAKHLGISSHTVDTYVRRIFEKLDVNTRTGAIFKCLGFGANALKPDENGGAPGRSAA